MQLPPLHPKTKGLAEKGVSIAQNCIKASESVDKPLHGYSWAKEHNPNKTRIFF